MVLNISFLHRRLVYKHSSRCEAIRGNVWWEDAAIIALHDGFCACAMYVWWIRFPPSSLCWYSTIPWSWWWRRQCISREKNREKDKRMDKGCVSTFVIVLSKWCSHHNSVPTTLPTRFGKRIKVTGILYLHNITINRLTEPLPHYEIFRKLCGNQYPASVVLVLTMCEEVNAETCQMRRDYLTKHWKKMMGEKAAVYSHSGTKKSAWEGVATLGVL